MPRTTRLGVRNDNAQAVDELETEHPVICAHPATGRRYVFVSSVLTRFKGMTEGGEQAHHRLPAGAGHAARVHVPAALGAGNARRCGPIRSCCTRRSTTIPAIAASRTAPPWKATCRRLRPSIAERRDDDAGGVTRTAMTSGRRRRSVGHSHAAAWPLLAPVHAAGARRHRPARALRRVAEPHVVDVRQGADLRRSRKLRRMRCADPYFWRALRNTVVVVLIVVHVELVARPRHGAAVRERAAGRRWLLAAVLAPYAVSEVSAAVIWRFLFDRRRRTGDGRAARARPAVARMVGRAGARPRHRRAAVDLAAPAVHVRHPVRGAPRDPDAPLRSGAARRRAARCRRSATSRCRC